VDEVRRFALPSAAIARIILASSQAIDFYIFDDQTSSSFSQPPRAVDDKNVIAGLKFNQGNPGQLSEEAQDAWNADD
jgi:hypothetical protein